MWDLPRPGLEPVSPALAGRFSTTAPPGKPRALLNTDYVGYIQEHVAGNEHGAAGLSDKTDTAEGRNQDGILGEYGICVSSQLGHLPGTSGGPRTPKGMGGTPSNQIGVLFYLVDSFICLFFLIFYFSNFILLFILRCLLLACSPPLFFFFLLWFYFTFLQLFQL